MKVGLKWIISFSVIAIVAIGGLFWNPAADIPDTRGF